MKTNDKRVLLIEPNFPNLTPKNKNKYLPIGLLKLGSYYQNKGYDVKLQRLCESVEPLDFKPTIIHITSSFTYYSKQVIDAVEYAKYNYNPNKLFVGGIWASLMPKVCKELTGANIIKGICQETEKLLPNYSLLSEDTDYQIIHTMRGCNRKCPQCSGWDIEPLHFEKSITDKILKKKVVIYDNNFLLNPYIESILEELIELKKNKKISTVESQSGFDGRILRKKPYLASLLKESGFIKPKIAWDVSYKTREKREEEINILSDGGFPRRLTSVFILFNFQESLLDVENKRKDCFKWGVQVTSSRYRPLNSLYDNYRGSKKKQTNKDYYIAPNWTDEQVKLFVRNVREHNIAIRYGSDFYSADFERKRLPKSIVDKVKHMDFDQAQYILDDAWCPLYPRLNLGNDKTKSLDGWF